MGTAKSDVDDVKTQQTSVQDRRRQAFGENRHSEETRGKFLDLQERQRGIISESISESDNISQGSFETQLTRLFS